MWSPLIQALLFGRSTSAKSIVPSDYVPSQWLVNNPRDHDETIYKIPSVHESAVMARRILHLTTIGTIVTSFPSAQDTSATNDGDDLEIQENRPPGVENSPIGLMEYYADCEPYTGNPTLLALNVATPFRNYKAGSNISLSVRWWPEQTSSYADTDEIFTPHTPAALPRFSLHGHLEPIDADDLKNRRIPSCFMHAHPDSKWWQPGNRIHEAQYMRLVVDYVYWLGGFGDRARIQWLPLDEWRNVTMEEVVKIRLPGEKKRRRSWFEGWKLGL